MNLETKKPTTWTGLMKKAGQSNKLTTTTQLIGAVEVEIKTFESTNYIYQRTGGEAAIYRKEAGGQLTQLSDNDWASDGELIMTEWAAMLADQKKKASKSNPELAAKLEKADTLLKEITDRIDQLVPLGFTIAKGWKKEGYYLQKLKKNDPQAQVATAQPEPTIGDLVDEKTAQTPQLTAVTGDQGENQ